MSDELAEIGGGSVTVVRAYSVVSLITLFAFVVGWLWGRKKKTGQPIFAGQVMNGFGFGLLPAMAVFKAFQSWGSERGIPVTEPLPVIPWLSEEGCYMPCRIEMAAALVSFLLIGLWLILRRDPLPDNGDLLLISLCFWAMIRLNTEDFYMGYRAGYRIASWAALLLSFALWCGRRNRVIRSPGRTALDLVSVAACAAVYGITAEGLVSLRSPIADYAVKTGCGLLALVLTLTVGADLRRMNLRAGQTD